MQHVRRLRFPAMLLVFLVAGALLAARVDVSITRVAGSGASATSDTYRPVYRQGDGPELLMLFVSSSECAWSTKPELPAAVESLKLQLAGFARDQGLRFRTVGVATDWITQRGVNHLATFGDFDEISVGGKWTNSTLLDQVWNRGGPVSTPSVWIFRRDLTLASDSVLLIAVQRSNEELLLARSGVPEIQTLASLDPERYLNGVAEDILSARVGGVTEAVR